VAAAERGLLFSAILLPPGELTPLLPLLAGIAVVDGIQSSLPVRLDLKWPNDLLSQGQKLGGILLERPAGQGMILGIGLNVNLLSDQLPPGGEATSLLLLLGAEVPREPLLASILNALDSAYCRLLKEGAQWVPEEWRRRSSMLGQAVTFSQDATSHTGIAEDIGVDGALLVRLKDGRLQRLIAGEVTRVRVD
jgi:BirA family biotin operon repressor/biotin-[acetyl-CoA-carboxylase] ligase